MAGRPSRRQDILEALARELESRPGSRITTAGLADAAGVSEAALYRHFASKAKMFEALIEFAEQAVFERIAQIIAEEPRGQTRCAALLYLLLGFAARNPGITRVLLGEALVGENVRLHGRVNGFFAHLEEQLREILREAPLRVGGAHPVSAEDTADMLLAMMEGRLHRYMRSGFSFSPLAGWERQWEQVARVVFRPESV